MPELPPLVRNHKIVGAVHLLIATPKTDKEELRSGTWATIRYAKKVRLSTCIVYPDGTKVVDIKL